MKMILRNGIHRIQNQKPPERQPETRQQWLRMHPPVELLSRKLLQNQKLPQNQKSLKCLNHQLHAKLQRSKKHKQLKFLHLEQKEKETMRLDKMEDWLKGSRTSRRRRRSDKLLNASFVSTPVSVLLTILRQLCHHCDAFLFLTSSLSLFCAATIIHCVRSLCGRPNGRRGAIYEAKKRRRGGLHIWWALSKEAQAQWRLPRTTKLFIFGGSSWLQKWAQHELGHDRGMRLFVFLLLYLNDTGWVKVRY